MSISLYFSIFSFTSYSMTLLRLKYLATNPILFISDSVFICWDVFLHYTAYINTCNFILFQTLVETSIQLSNKAHISINLNFRFHTHPTCGVFAVQVPINAPGGRKANERTTSTIINSLARINTTTMRINREPSTNSSIFNWLFGFKHLQPNWI